MKLREWLDQEPERTNQLAAAVGSSHNHISQISRGEKGCSLALAVKISAATGGDVSCEEIQGVIEDRKSGEGEAA